MGCGVLGRAAAVSDLGAGAATIRDAANSAAACTVAHLAHAGLDSRVCFGAAGLGVSRLLVARQHVSSRSSSLYADSSRSSALPSLSCWPCRLCSIDLPRAVSVLPTR